jgi:hypothetical protein
MKGRSINPGRQSTPLIVLYNTPNVPLDNALEACLYHHCHSNCLDGSGAPTPTSWLEPSRPWSAIDEEAIQSNFDGPHHQYDFSRTRLDSDHLCPRSFYHADAHKR